MSDEQINPTSFCMVEKVVALDKTISLEARFIYLLIATFVHHPKKTCFPSIETLAELSGKGRKFVIKYLAELEAKKAIAKTQVKGRNNTYVLLHRDAVNQGIAETKARRRSTFKAGNQSP